MLLKLKASLPPGIRRVILATRGLDRASIIVCCRRLGLD